MFLPSSFDRLQGPIFISLSKLLTWFWIICAAGPRLRFCNLLQRLMRLRIMRMSKGINFSTLVAFSCDSFSMKLSQNSAGLVTRSSLWSGMYRGSSGGVEVSCPAGAFKVFERTHLSLGIFGAH